MRSQITKGYIDIVEKGFLREGQTGLTGSDVVIQRVNVVQQLQSGRGKAFAAR